MSVRPFFPIAVFMITAACTPAADATASVEPEAAIAASAPSPVPAGSAEAAAGEKAAATQTADQTPIDATAIPRKFGGRWNRVLADCELNNDQSDGSLLVEDHELIYRASTVKIDFVTIINDRRIEYEGAETTSDSDGAWNHVGYMEMSADENTATMRGPTPASVIYHRCPVDSY